MLKIRRTAQTGARTIGALSTTVLLIAATGCVASGARSSQAEPVTLKIGFGNTAGTDASVAIGIKSAARTVAGLERLVRNARDGRTLPGLAESWSLSRDGLTWRFRLRPSARFHDGKPADAEVIRRIVEARLPGALGPAFEDVAEIRTVSDRDLEIVLKKRSTFLMEQLAELAIEEPGSAPSGSGPFYETSQQGDEIEMRANASYYGGKPAIDRIVFKPYTSVRSAWAELLRGQVDMLYDVGVDALDSLESSNDVKVFTFQTHLAYMALLNPQRPNLRDPAFRRQLNAAIDRDALVAVALKGHGTPAVSAVWPHHWAYTSDLPRFGYDPHPVASGQGRRRLTCIFNEPAYERLAIALQRQLQEIDVDLELELVSGEQFPARLRAGDFDLFLADFLQGPNMVRPYLFWHTGGPFNYGHFSSVQVDTALDTIRHAADDSTYQAGVAAFEVAMVNDPPAIFLAWRERARAVSSRFHVVVDPGADVLFTMHEWRPASDPRAARGN
jgi:peptide/nickel transport system substrate-binding protein